MSSSRFAAINEIPLGPEPTASEPEPAKPTKKPANRTTERPDDRTTTRPKGKRSDPDYEKVGLYLHADRRKRAERKWEDEKGGDLSDLIDQLLRKYLGDRSTGRPVDRTTKSGDEP